MQIAYAAMRMEQKLELGLRLNQRLRLELKLRMFDTEWVVQ